MASPGEMVKVIAGVLGVPEPQVVQHDRNLTVAGLRTVGGRGRSAAKMTPLDAANLLIGVTASSMVKETVEIVNEYADLPSASGEMSVRKDARSFENNGNPPTTWNLPGFPIPALLALPEHHTFRSALVALIEAATNDTLCDAIKKLTPFSEEHHIPNFWNIEVILMGPYPQASIRIYCKDFSEKHIYSAIPTDIDAIMKWSDEISGKRDDGDLKQIREFSAKTILALGNLLKR